MQPIPALHHNGAKTKTSFEASRQFQQFKFWPNKFVSYDRINKNIASHFNTWEVGLEDYSTHDHQTPILSHRQISSRGF